ncbi:Hypothetical predicted protein [Cloeon dipterum]|uniref:Uncharacterized protein n=1 Tax=Cloeon dipterum TaxID=197152 RepID=A0A8S1D2D3_9INSE|nr:Hypothetical predicted protein [Cloeon dipterum]
MNYEIAKHVAHNIDKYVSQKSDLRNFCTTSEMSQMTVDILGKRMCTTSDGDYVHFLNLLTALKDLLDSRTQFFNTLGFMSYCPRDRKSEMMPALLKYACFYACNLIDLVIDGSTAGCHTLNKGIHVDKEILLNRFCKEIPLLRYIDAPGVKIDCFIHIASGVIKKSVYMNDKFEFNAKNQNYCDVVSSSMA